MVVLACNHTAARQYCCHSVAVHEYGVPHMYNAPPGSRAPQAMRMGLTTSALRRMSAYCDTSLNDLTSAAAAVCLAQMPSTDPPERNSPAEPRRCHWPAGGSTAAEALAG